MSHGQLLADLAEYQSFWGNHDGAMVERYRRFVETTPECCSRTHLAGHCTGSALICCPRGERILLLYHPFLQRWLQPGGHADGDGDLLAVARREANEETGLTLEQLKPYRWLENRRVPLDLDIHDIPARKQEPAHLHYDLRFLFLAPPEAPLTPETPDLRLAWLSPAEVAERTDEESVLRMVRKLASLPRDDHGRLPSA